MRSPTSLISTCREKLHEKHVATKRMFSSRENFVRAMEVNETATGRDEERTFWKNEDLDLTPPEQWTWGWYDFAAFWWSYGFSVGVWSVGSSMVAMGLNSWQCMRAPNFHPIHCSLFHFADKHSNHLRLHLPPSRCNSNSLALPNRRQMALRVPCRKPRHLGHVRLLLPHLNTSLGRPDLDCRLDDAGRLLYVHSLPLYLRQRLA